jgi:hypothetical protein
MSGAKRLLVLDGQGHEALDLFQMVLMRVVRSYVKIISRF